MSSKRVRFAGNIQWKSDVSIFSVNVVLNFLRSDKKWRHTFQMWAEMRVYHAKWSFIHSVNVIQTRMAPHFLLKLSHRQHEISLPVPELFHAYSQTKRFYTPIHRAANESRHKTRVKTEKHYRPYLNTSAAARHGDRTPWGGGEIFRARLYLTRDPPSLQNNWYWVFPGGKAAEASDHPPLYNAEGALWYHVKGWPLPACIYKSTCDITEQYTYSYSFSTFKQPYS
jgi:hypothetical protein